MTRAEFYSQKYSGGYRTARKEFLCEQDLCLTRVTPGQKYFDTCQVTTWPKKKRICAGCAEGECK